MKLFFLLLFLIITIEYIQSKKALRTYVVKRDDKIKRKQLSAYTVYDSIGKNILYRLIPFSTDIDTIILFNYPEKNMIANLEGEWIDDIFNVTFSIYDKKLYNWMDGIIQLDKSGWSEKYVIFWNSKHLNTKNGFFSTNVSVYNAQKKELLAEFWNSSGWFSSDRKFDLKIYSDYVLDTIYFFLLAIDDHRWQIKLADA